MKNVTYRLQTHNLHQYTAIEQGLEAMAARGWRLDKIGAFWRYRRAEPADVHYTVTYFVDASAYDPGPTRDQENFADFCESAGWRLAAQNAQLMVFENEQPDPVPLDTDEGLKLTNIRRAMRRSLLPSSLAMIFVCLMQLGLVAADLLRDPVRYLSMGGTFSRMGCWLLLMLSFALTLLDYRVWSRRSEKSVAAGGGCVPSGTGGLARLANALPWASLACVLLMVGSLSGRRWGPVLTLAFGCAAFLWGGCALVLHLLKKSGNSRKYNRTVYIAAVVVLAVVYSSLLTFGAIRLAGRGLLKESEPVRTFTWQQNGIAHERDLYADELPLTVEDILPPVDYEHYSYEAHREESFLYRRLEATQRAYPYGAEVPDLDYVLYEVKFPAMTDWTARQLCREMQRYNNGEWRVYMEPIDPAPWGAQGAWQRVLNGEPDRGTVFLSWPGRVAELYLDDAMLPLSEVQRGIIREKLTR